MISCYHPNVVQIHFHTLEIFKDAFKHVENVVRVKGKTAIEYAISANGKVRQTGLLPVYFSATNRRVVNRVKSKFIFERTHHQTYYFI
jgi:hypothetical protein